MTRESSRDNIKHVTSCYCDVRTVKHIKYSIAVYTLKISANAFLGRGPEIEYFFCPNYIGLSSKV